jgi:hypothetical protein
MMADDKDIPANFLVEDNELLEDDHLPEDEPVRKRHSNCNRLALKLTSFQRDTLPYFRYWIKGFINPLNST